MQWRVEKNGLYLSQFNNGDPAVISHFAYIHDCMRINEHIDNGHGLRGGQYALKNKDILDLTDDQLHTHYTELVQVIQVEEILLVIQ